MLSPSTQVRALIPTVAIRPKDSVRQACLVGDVTALQSTRFNMNTPVFEGLLPVHIAAAAGQAKVVRALAGMGADLQQVDCKVNRNTALHFAVLARKEDVVDALLAEGVHVDPENCVGTTPIHDAARVGDEGIVAKLWGGGAAWERPNGYGNTILHRAALYGRLSLVTWLGRHVPGAKRAEFFAARNANGYTAYDIAVSCGAKEMARTLRAIGADITRAGPDLLASPYSERAAWQAYQKETLATQQAV